MNLKEIRKQLPHGAIKDIAKQLGISEGLVSMTLNEKTNSPQKTKIIRTTANYLREYKEQEQQAMEVLQTIAHSFL